MVLTLSIKDVFEGILWCDETLKCFECQYSALTDGHVFCR